MTAILKKTLTVILLIIMAVLGLALVLLPTAASYLPEYRWFFAVSGLYCLISFRVTWGLGDDRNSSILLCKIKGVVVAICIGVLWLHCVAPSSFAGGMPQAADTVLEFSVLLVCRIEAVAVMMRLLINKCLKPLAEKLNLELDI